ncbi:hypothetical protein BaRGS_00014176 [Batillaria attramentaria]|uniref:Uncharacterized protein n=1 Tax=Batillaria attramentaria TaxID=370345 RepID=A0ABD0L5M3_9CAEN
MSVATAAGTSSERGPGDTGGAGHSAVYEMSASKTCCKGHYDADVTIIAATDIPAHVTAGPYPGGLGFASRVTDEAVADTIIKVEHCGSSVVQNN